MKIAIALVLAAAACGGSKKSSTKPTPPSAAQPTKAAPVASTEPATGPVTSPTPAPDTAAVTTPEPAPAPPPPSFTGWYASANYSVALSDGGTATVETRGKKASKAKKGTWDESANTLTVDKKATPIKLEGDELIVTVGGAEQKLARQPVTFNGTTFANEKGSIQLNADGTCVHGQAGKPAMCTYKLENGKLAISYQPEAKKKAVSWVVWFEPGGKVMRTPKETFTATE